MRILVLNYEFPPVGGGGGRASADLAEALAARGHDLRVLTSAVPGLKHSTTAAGVEVTRLRTGRRSASRAGFMEMMGYVLTAAPRAAGVARRWPADVIHAHFAVPTGAAAWISSRWSGRPYVLTVHLGDIPGGVPEKTERWFRWVGPLTPPIWKGAARLVAVSDYTRRLASEAYGVQAEVIPNGIDLSRRRPRAVAAGDPPRIVFAGRFQPQKNPVFLVDLLAQVRDLAWTAVLVGDGPLRDEVEGHVRRTGLDGRVRLTGWLPAEQAEEQIAISDLLLMPSRAEGLPVVALQALAHGLAIVGSRVGGLSELIVDGQNGYGLLPDDAPGFRDALRCCLSDRQTLSRMKATSHGMAVRFDLNRVADAYEALYRQVVAG